jgi:hypothetical protein
VFSGTFLFWYPSPDMYLNTVLSRSFTDNSFDIVAWFSLRHAMSTVGPCIDRPYNGLNTYAYNVFLFFNTFAKKSKNMFILVIMGYIL